MSCHLAELHGDTRANEIVVPQTFVKAFHDENVATNRFTPCDHHDAEEFFTELLRIVENDYAHISATRTDELTKLFQFNQLSEMTCLICGNSTETVESTNTFQVILERTADTINLTDLLKPSLQKHFDEQNFYSCCVCRRHVHAINQVTLTTLPVLLFVHLKRFQYAGTICSNVKIPIQLNLHDCMSVQTAVDSENTNYELIAIVNYVQQRSHYVTIVHNEEQFVVFDDHTANEFDFSNLDLSEPYLLLYQKRSFQPDVSIPTTSSHCDEWNLSVSNRNRTKYKSFALEID